MARIAYRLEADKDLEIVNNSWLYDIDEDFTSKAAYIKRAKKLTDRANKEFNTNFTYKELFGEPLDLGWRYCSQCGECYWFNDIHEC